MNGNHDRTMSRAERRAKRAREQYFTSFWQEVNRLLGRTGVRVQDREDCTSYICLWLLGREDALVAAYTPARLAAVCTTQRAVDFIRKMAHQVPHAGYDASKHEARLKFTSFDALVDPDKSDSLTYEEVITGDRGFEKTFESRVESEVESTAMYQATLKKVTDKMTDMQKAVWIDVDIEKMKVVKSAEKNGLKREYAQRRLGEARKIVRDFGLDI